jgi:hypothetical protein
MNNTYEQWKRKRSKKTADDDDDNTQYAESKLGADVLINFLRAGAFDVPWSSINHQQHTHTQSPKHNKQPMSKEKWNNDFCRKTQCSFLLPRFPFLDDWWLIEYMRSKQQHI